MPKLAPSLAAYQVKRLTTPGLHAVGGVPGLQLSVKHSGARSWVLRATVGSKRRDIGLGGYPRVTLAKARERAAERRLLIDEGLDPVLEKQKAKQALRDEQARLDAEQAKRITFDEAAKRCWQAKSPEFKNAKHAQQWINTLRTYASPVIGTLPVADVAQPHVVAVLQPIWKSKTETASRLRGRVEAVLAWSKVAGYRNGDNPALWKGNLEHVLAKPSKVRRTTNHAALPWPEVPEFMVKLREREGMAAKALEFAILAAARSGEIRFARWDEIDLDAKLWKIPASRMKAGKEHVVPLAPSALRLLKKLPRMEGSDFVFPSGQGREMSDMALSSVCRRMGVSATPHGFRSSFKDWCRNNSKQPDEVSELCLAHVSSDSTRAAYARDGLIEQRRKLLKQWARFCG